ncbi:MAG: hypothetical protein EX271_12660 [Acidimicrobiales bacterium]|nr:hypothetical protein [Hyphomonadaceae bacterium]RZV35866.1 MAG: hypothetical protein EX271_12660 [Acidimicrobiales bacterium]
MRILLCSAAAIALSGCSWFGYGHNQNHHQSYGSGQYAQQATGGECCFGSKKLSRWNVEAGAGPDFMVGGDVFSGSEAHGGFTGPVTALNDVSMNDAYNTGYRAEIGGSYAFTPSRKLTGQVFYAQADGQDVLLGTQDGVDLRGQFSDYKSWGVEAGLRQYFRPADMPLVRTMRPYVEGKLGAAHVDSIGIENMRETVPTAAGTPTSLALYEDGWVPTAAGMIGFETPLFNRMTVGVETGIRYTGKPNSDNTDMTATTAPLDFNRRYAGANNSGDRFTVPVTIRGRYRF